MSILSILQW